MNNAATAFINVNFRFNVFFFTLVDTLWTNMNKYWTTVFILTNINKDEYINLINA